MKDMRECSRVLECAKPTAHVGMYFTSGGIDWDDAVVCTITDASFCNQIVLNNGELEGNTSQQ